MTDTNLESDQASGNDGTANSAASQGAGDKPTSTFDEAKLLERVGALVKSEIEKSSQSIKDRRFDKMEKFQTEYQPVLDKVKDLLTPEQLATVQRDLEWDEMKRRTGLTPTTQAQQTGSPQPVAGNDSEVISKLGLDVNDAEVSQYVREHGADILGLAQIAIRKANKPVPSPADALALAGGATSTNKSVEALTDEYKNDMRAAPKGSAGQSARQAIKDKYKKQGVPVHEIDFT